MEYFYPKFLWKSNVSNMKIPEQSTIDNMCLQSQHSQGRWENHKSEPSLGYKANILKKKKPKGKERKKTNMKRMKKRSKKRRKEGKSSQSTSNSLPIFQSLWNIIQLKNMILIQYENYLSNCNSTCIFLWNGHFS